MSNPHIWQAKRPRTMARFRRYRRISLEDCTRYHYLSRDKLFEMVGEPLVAGNPIDRMLDEIFEGMGEAGLSQAELARRMGSAPKVVSFALYRGKASLAYLRRMWDEIEKAKGET